VYAQITWKWSEDTVAVLQEIKDRYGGSVFGAMSAGFSSGGTRIVHFVIHAKKAAKLIADILPYLRIKQRQAAVCLEMARTVGQFNRWHPKPEEAWTKQEAAYLEVRGLNTKNGKGRLWLTHSS
jgi:hypothetical protein